MSSIIGVGTDFVEIDRVRKAIEKNEHFLERVFTEQEISCCNRKANKWQSFAARFAAKEAVSKAFGTGLGAMGLTNIEVLNKASGQPEVHLYGAAKELAEENSVRCVHISLSHSELYAMATAVAEGD